MINLVKSLRGEAVLPKLLKESIIGALEGHWELAATSCGSDGKASVYNAGDLGLIPGSGRKWQSTPVLLLGKSYGQRSLVGYSPWGRRVGNN